MTWDICRICSGDCCTDINLIYAKSGKRVYPPRVKKLLEQYPFLNYNDKQKRFSCGHYKNGRCEIYEERPYWCKRFFCSYHNAITEVGFLEGQL